MTIPTVEFVFVMTFLPILAVTAFLDLRDMRIPNALSLAGLLLFAVSLPFIGFDEWMLRAMIGAIVFSLCFGLFAIGWFGGGDAKILPVTSLFVPAAMLQVFMMSFAFAMTLGMIGIWLARLQFSRADASWVSMQPGAGFPMGISIAASLPLTIVFAQLL